MTRRILSPIALLAILLLLTIGCGGPQSGGDEASAAAAPAQEAAPEASPAPEADSAAAGVSGSPCEALTEAQVAGVFGIDASAVTEAAGEAANYSKNAEDCLWKFSAAGLQSIVKLYVRVPSEKNQIPNPMSFLIKSYLETGETIGSKTIAQEAASLGGTGEGALSEAHGNQFTRERTYSWAQGEEALYRLSVSHTLEEEGATLEDPSPETMEQLVAAVLAP